ncbi:N-acetyltransferase [Pediococcus ethanolidurans]|nr:N-acetyltransferase [Pediococcus ethanolidurans]
MQNTKATINVNKQFLEGCVGMEFTNDGKKISFTYHEKIGGCVTYFFIKKQETIVIEQVFVNPELRGQGLAQQLMLKILSFAKEQHKKIYPLCPYARTYLKKHTEYQALIDDHTTLETKNEMEKNNGSK